MARLRRIPLGRLALAAALLIAIAGVGLASLESADVRITVPAQKVQAHLELNLAGTPSLDVSHLTVEVTDSAEATASAVTVSPAYATGAVRFQYTCPAIGTCPLPWTLPAGALVATFGGVKFETVAAATFTVGSGQRQSVPVRALAVGSAGNQSAGAIEVVVNQIPGRYMQVVNLQATSGGVDGGTRQIVQQADFDAARLALESRITDELGAAMKAKAAGMTYFVDGPPMTSLTSDHSVGDTTSVFTLTMTGTLGSRAFSNKAAAALLRQAMKARLLPGYTLEGPIQSSFQAAAGSADAVAADGIGYAVPGTSSTAIASRLAGTRSSDAVARIRQEFPGSAVWMRTSPLPLPWMPLLSGRIRVTMTIERPSI